jgi:hypothetical protein
MQTARQMRLWEDRRPPSGRRVASAGIHALVALGSLAMASQGTWAQPSVRQTPVEVVTPAPPIPVVVDGKRVLVYELHVTNFGLTPLAVRRIDIFSSEHGTAPLETYTDSALAACLQLVGSPMGSAGSTRLDAGQRVIAFIWITLPTDAPLPVQLRHRLTFGGIDTSPTNRATAGESAIDNVIVPVLDAAVPVLSPPMRGGEWLAGSGPSNTSDHRRSVVPLNGAAHIAQRFAIDWVLVGKNGNTVHDDPRRNENFWGYGQPVHAVADGEVTDAVDSIADNTPRSPLPPVTVANIAGNYVIIRIAPNRYVLFAHLQQGSIRVHLHQRVRRGEVLGLLGNSGQATSPHLHMHVMNQNSPLASEGVPFVLDTYTFLGNGRDFPENRHSPIPRHNELPAEDEVVGFP